MEGDKRMIVRRSLVALVCGFLVAPALGQTAGSFSVQGLLKDAQGDPITGLVDLQFRLFDAESVGSLVDWNGDGFVDDVVGLDVQEIIDVQVAAGLFVTKPGGALSPTAFDGNERWLEISVSDGGSRSASAPAPLRRSPSVLFRLSLPETRSGNDSAFR